MDQVIEERIENSDGKILKRLSYRYNERGECIQTISYLSSSQAITSIEYNAYGEVEN